VTAEEAGVKYRQLGRTDLNVSVVGLGTWQLGGEWGKRFGQPEVDALVGRANELGINLIDTAECYGDHLAESLIGRAIGGNRNDWILALERSRGRRGRRRAAHPGNNAPREAAFRHSHAVALAADAAGDAGAAPRRRGGLPLELAR
jgi:aryl-alcohol dehydrogenase-like predicted oxidoreductase